jgi:2-methylisocitrate lyase-like PEP mutase family enzyme
MTAMAMKRTLSTIHIYDRLGASAIFMEDQKSPKRCGHMGGKKVIEPQKMVNKIRAACSARRDPDQLFIIARTDAIAVNGVDDALRRGKMYLKAGADGIYIEGPRNLKELEAVGRAFKGEPLVVTMLEGGGVTPWASPQEFHKLGFNMILYPTTLLFRQTRAIQHALNDLKAGRPMPDKDSVTMTEFEKLVDIAYWKSIEEKAIPLGEKVRQTINKLVKKTA